MGMLSLLLIICSLAGQTRAFGLFRGGITRHALTPRSGRRQHAPVLREQTGDGDTDKPPYKVLLLVEPTPFGYVSGYKNRFEEMLKFLRKSNDDVRILTADPNPSTAAREFLGYPITINRGWEFHLYPLVTLTYDFACNTPRMAEEMRPDLLHVSSPSAILYPAILWSWYYEIPLVMSYHTDFQAYGVIYGHKLLMPLWFAKWLGKTLVKVIHSFADLTLCTSPQLKDSMLSLDIQEELVDVWQKGINVERFNPRFRSEAMRSRLSNGRPEDPLLIYVGRLGAEKKLTKLKRVLDEHPSARLAFVGKGPPEYEKELRALFAGNDRVVFTGQIIGDELSAAFASADIFVMPSDSETLGFVVLESMASGVPVVSVAAGGLIDIVDEGSTGYLVSNTDDMGEFSQRTGQLIADVQTRQRMGVNCRRYAEGWSWEAATRKLRNEQYAKAIENHREARAVPKEVQASLMHQANMFRPDLA